MIAIAKVFTVNNRQAILLPDEFRVDALKMWVTCNEATGEITLKPKANASGLRAFLKELRSQPATEEFIPRRDDGSLASRSTDPSATAGSVRPSVA
jgi:virulence-associated protein VagC